eukprot:01210.XXX_2136_2345_1 [CDS] Oithona nana genome sequencing.
MESKLVLCLTLLCLLGTVFTAPAPTVFVVGPAAAGAVTVTGGGALLGGLALGKLAVLKGLLIGSALRRG